MFAESVQIKPRRHVSVQRFQEVQAGLFTDKPLGTVLLLPVNAYIKNNGKAVMAKNCGLVAKQRFRGIDLNWGKELQIQGRQMGNRGMFKTEAVGNYPAIIWKRPGDTIKRAKDPIIVACPTQWHFVEQADLSLIERSLSVILSMADHYNWNNIFLPEIGCGQGARSWKDEIKPICVDYLDERFTVCHLTDRETW
jgi:hypothetical protein